MQNIIHANSYTTYVLSTYPTHFMTVHGFKNPHVFALYILQNWVYAAILDQNKGSGLIYSNLMWEFITVLVNINI